MNPIIRLLILTDFFVLAGLGLTAPIFAIFVDQNLVGGSIAAAGVAQMIYMIVKAIVQLGVGWYNDRDVGNVREFWTSLVGYALIAIVPFLYAIVQTITQLYMVQALFGVAAALTYPGFMTIFTKFLDKQREGREWSVYSTTVFIGMAITAAVGAWMVEQYGFTLVFRAVGVITVLGFIAYASLGRYYTDFKLDHHPPKHHHRDLPPVK